METIRVTYGFVPRESGKTRSIGYSREVLPTMNADGNYAVLVEPIVFRDDITIKIDGGIKHSPLAAEILRERNA